jgi:hypothetical protein
MSQRVAFAGWGSRRRVLHGERNGAGRIVRRPLACFNFDFQTDRRRPLAFRLHVEVRLGGDRALIEIGFAEPRLEELLRAATEPVVDAELEWGDLAAKRRSGNRAAYG